MVIDVRNGSVIPTMPGGVMGQISFTRLTALLKTAGEIQPNETLTHIDIRTGPNGYVQYRVDYADPLPQTMEASNGR